MSEWDLVRLDQVIALDIETALVTATASYDIVGVLNRGRGLLIREPIAGNETSYKTLNRIRPNQIVYSRLKAFEGAITVAPNDLGEVYASQEFPTFTCGERMMPEYFRLLTSTRRLWDQMQALSTGMGGRRERVKPASFLTIEVNLPTLSEQRRIVDALAVVDAQAAALQAEISAVCRVLKARRAELVASPRNDVVKAERAFGILMGRQRSPQRTKGPSMTPYLRSANVGNGELNLGDVKEMDFDRGEQERYALRVGDVLVSEGSASANAVGMAAVYGGEMDGVVCFQNTLLRYRAIQDVSTPSFTNHWCKWAYESGMFREAASGTNIKHIGSKRAVTMPVALPTLDEQYKIGGELDSLEEAWLLRRTELAYLRSFRSALLTSFLTQAIEIPESYDDLLEGVS